MGYIEWKWGSLGAINTTQPLVWWENYLYCCQKLYYLDFLLAHTSGKIRSGGAVWLRWYWGCLWGGIQLGVPPLCDTRGGVFGWESQKTKSICTHLMEMMNHRKSPRRAPSDKINWKLFALELPFVGTTIYGWHMGWYMEVIRIGPPSSFLNSRLSQSLHVARGVRKLHD